MEKRLKMTQVVGRELAALLRTAMRGKPSGGRARIARSSPVIPSPVSRKPALSITVGGIPAGAPCALLRAKASKGREARYGRTSALARIAGGMLMPSAFAVRSFTTISNCVGCATGSPPGAAPSLMRRM